MRLKSHRLQRLSHALRCLEPTRLYIARGALQLLDRLLLHSDHVLGSLLLAHQVLYKQMLVALLDALSPEHVLLVIFNPVFVTLPMVILRVQRLSRRISPLIVLLHFLQLCVFKFFKPLSLLEESGVKFFFLVLNNLIAFRLSLLRFQQDVLPSHGYSGEGVFEL